MKRIPSWAVCVLLATLGSSLSSPASAAPRPDKTVADCGAKVDKPNGEPWRCTFADDFTGSELDPTKWQPLTTAATNLRGSGDCWVDSSENIAVEDGMLRLTSQREDEPFECTTAGGKKFEADVSSGSVTTFGGFAQAYGRWDIRARFPEVTLPGSHGGVWLSPQRQEYGEWPASGEIDIAQFYSLYLDRVVPYIHYSPSTPDTTVTNTRCFMADPWNFHIYSLVWTRDRLVITIDGDTCVDHKIHAAEPLSGSQPFDQPFVVNLTQALGVGANTPVEGTPLPLTTEVDYVHVWR